jgi:hypothetical protein
MNRKKVKIVLKADASGQVFKVERIVNSLRYLPGSTISKKQALELVGADRIEVIVAP